MKRIRDLIREVHRRSLWQVLGVYALGSWAVLGGVGTLGDVLGLPDWFPRLALGLLVVGLPVVLATAFVQEGGPGQEADGPEGPADHVSGASGLFTWRRAFTGGVLAFALWGVVAAAWVLFGAGTRRPEPVAASGPEGTQRRLVVLPLENLTEDPELAVLGRLAADEIAREIDRRQPVAVIPSTTVANAIRSLGDDPPVEVLADAVRATHAFAGTVSRLGAALRLEVELIDPSTSERLRSVEPVTGPPERTDSLVSELAGRAATEAVVVFNPSAAPWVGDMSSPASAVAYQAFLEQMSAFCEGDYPAAIAAGRRATRESPRFVAALFNLMLAYRNTGRAAQADSLRSVLEGLRGEMTRNEELSLDAWGAMWDGDVERAERAMDEAHRLDPVGRAGGALQIKVRAGKMAEAVRVLQDVDLESCPFPGFYLDGSDAYHALGRFREELELARRARVTYPDDPRFLMIEARALALMGRREAVDSLLRTLDGFPAPVRIGSQIMTIREMRAHGLQDLADRITEAALATLAEQPASRDAWLGRVEVLYNARRWEESLGLLEGSRGFEDVVARSLGNRAAYGTLLARVGRRGEASAVAEEIATIESGTVSQRNLARAQLAAALGDGDEAVRLLGLSEASWFFLHTDPSFDEIRSYPPFVALTTSR